MTEVTVSRSATTVRVVDEVGDCAPHGHGIEPVERHDRGRMALELGQRVVERTRIAHGYPLARQVGREGPHGDGIADDAPLAEGERLEHHCLATRVGHFASVSIQLQMEKALKGFKIFH